ncbi:hypothetical protein BJY04DRAFT_213475 [Aspergillus karnatakaensis]|uniref:uncharacterized protein n=1 Tax=Aspergillus karnatakaensis TaxID=1810916 RepID=UPI003CCD3364
MSKNAREALRWRVKHCIAMLSDDDILNDHHAYRSLFTTFVVSTESHKGREGALYLIKAHEENIRGLHEIAIQSQRASQDPTKEDTRLPEGSNAPHYHTDSSDDLADHLDDLGLRFFGDELDECSNCWKGMANIHFWYFCRSCPKTMLCGWCYRELRSADNIPASLQTCISEHEFYHTGGFLRPSEMVDEGKVPLISAEGERQVIWVEEWKDRLAEKWKTRELELEHEGGFWAWGIRVLPEPQRTRWAAFFQV